MTLVVVEQSKTLTSDDFFVWSSAVFCTCSC